MKQKHDRFAAMMEAYKCMGHFLACAPILTRHDSTQALGKARDVSHANGVVNVTVELNAKGKKFVQHMNTGPERYKLPTRRQRADALQSAQTFWGAVIVVLALIAFTAYTAGHVHGETTSYALMGQTR